MKFIFIYEIFFFFKCRNEYFVAVSLRKKLKQIKFLLNVARKHILQGHGTTLFEYYYIEHASTIFA